MGKTNDNVLKRYRNNVRVDPSSLSHYMCYYCGRMSSDRLEYQQHMLKVHEVLSQSYQLWSDHTMDTLGLRWSESKHPDEREMSGSLSPKKDSEDDDEDYCYEEDEKVSRKRRRDDDGAKSRGKKGVDKLKKEEMKRKIDAENKRRKRAEEKRREEQLKKEEETMPGEVKTTFPDNTEQEKPQTTSEVVDHFEDEKKPENLEKKKRRRTDGSRRRDDGQERDNTDVSALVKIIMEESKKKEASRQETEDEDIHSEPTNGHRKPCSANAFTTKYCKICKKGTHYTFATLFQHYIEHHHAVLKSFHYYGYEQTKLIGKKSLTERDYCQRCIIKFNSSKDYYQHMIDKHMFESVRCQPDFETATHADVEARLEFRERTLVCAYNFSFAGLEGSSNQPAAESVNAEVKEEVIETEEPKREEPSTFPEVDTAQPQSSLV